MKKKHLYVWEVQYVLRNQCYDAPAFDADTITAPSWSRAVERAEIEARKFHAWVKVRSVVCKMRLTA